MQVKNPGIRGLEEKNGDENRRADRWKGQGNGKADRTGERQVERTGQQQGEDDKGAVRRWLFSGTKLRIP